MFNIDLMLNPLDLFGELFTPNPRLVTPLTVTSNNPKFPYLGSLRYHRVKKLKAILPGYRK